MVFLDLRKVALWKIPNSQFPIPTTMLNFNDLKRLKPKTKGIDKSIGDEAVRVTVQALIRLNQTATAISLWPPTTIRTQQSGHYLSAFKGRGMEFDEVRPYQPGDDMRHLDWRVTARTGKVHTKLFREERERSVFLWVDYRAPMFFATRGVFKSVFAARAAALLAWTTHHHNDRVGGFIFSDTLHHELKPQRGKAQVLHFIKQLVEMPDKIAPVQREQIDKESALHALVRLRRVAHPGSLIFLISDFRNLNAQAESHLMQIARHNDVVMLFIYDALENQLPPKGSYRLSDGEGDITLNTANQQLVKNYHNRFMQHKAHLQELAQKHRLLLLHCATTDDPLTQLQHGLGRHHKR